MKVDYNAEFWKKKSVRRNAENKELKKRIKELKASRDKWKEKHIVSKGKLDAIQKEIEVLKKKIEKIKF